MKIFATAILLLTGIFIIKNFAQCKSLSKNSTELPMATDSVYYLTALWPEIEIPLPINSVQNLEGLVEIVVFEVVNPFKEIIQVEVSLVNGEIQSPTVVGAFSLFPPDNPSRYIFDLNQFLDDKNKWKGSTVQVRLIIVDPDSDVKDIKLGIKPPFVN